MTDPKKRRLPSGWGLVLYGVLLMALATLARAMSDGSGVLTLLGGLGFVLVLAGVAVISARRRRA